MEMYKRVLQMFATMKRLGSITVLAFVASFVGAASYTPQTVPNPKHSDKNNYVCNPDGIISQDDVAYLNLCAAQLETETGVELCVVAIDDIGEYDAFDFTYELFQRWGIGKEGKNTGVLLILVLDSRDIRIMTGGGIEGVLTDAVCNGIIQRDMMPALRKGDYSAGLCRGALRIFEVCTDGAAPEELRNASSVTNRYGYAEADKESEPDMASWICVALCLGVLIVVLWLLNRPKRCPQCGKRQLRKTSSRVLRAATYANAGTGVYTYCCKHCGYKTEKNFVIPRKTRTYVTTSSGMGGRGFGGGGFSGGSFGGGSTFGGGAGGKF